MGLHLDTFYGYFAMLYEPHSKTPSKRKKNHKQTNHIHSIHVAFCDCLAKITETKEHTKI